MVTVETTTERKWKFETVLLHLAIISFTSLWERKKTKQ